MLAGQYSQFNVDLTARGLIGYFSGFAHAPLIMKSSAAKSSAASPASFEAALQELEGLVQSLEDGGTSLEESLKAYERGVALLKYCQDTLGQAEQKIRLLDKGELQDLKLGAPTADGGN